MGIVAFLITVPTGYLTYVSVWPSAFLSTGIGVDDIDPGSGGGVVLRPPAPSASILAAVTSVLLVFFAGLASGLIGGELRSGRPYFPMGSWPRFLGSRIFFRLGLGGMYRSSASAAVLVDFTTGGGQYPGFSLGFIGLSD